MGPPVGYSSCMAEDSHQSPGIKVPKRYHDDAYERPIGSRYVDPVDVVWLATADEARVSGGFYRQRRSIDW